MMLLKCQCCEIEQEFASGEEAFQAGWDAPPHFTGYVCCDLCPAVCIVLGLGHEKAHAYWREHGRPKEFDVFTCGIEKHITCEVGFAPKNLLAIGICSDAIFPRNDDAKP